MRPARPLRALLAASLSAAALAAPTPVPAAPLQSQAPQVAGHVLARRYVYIATNFQVDDNVPALTTLIDRAVAAGYNGAIVADVKFGRLDDGSLLDRYYTNLRTVLTHAAARDFAMIPATAYFGYSSPLLWHNPDLAEGLPVRDAPFAVRNALLEPLPDGIPLLANGDFEDVAAGSDTFGGWSFQDAPGTATFADRNVRHGGAASLRMDDLGTTNAPYGNGRVVQTLDVAPYRNVHASVWVKTQDLRGGDVRLLVLGQDPQRTLQWNPVPVRPTQDWTRFDVTFNTLGYSQVLLYLGVWGGETGSIWWDDAAIEPAGLVNMIRRPGAPVSLTSADGSPIVEGTDVEPLADPLTGRVPYNGVYDLWHTPPTIDVPAGSRLREGEKVLASYYHTASIYGDQVAASLLEPEALSLTMDQMNGVRRQFVSAGVFSGWMFSHDEIRVHGWDEAPTEGSPGQDLARNVRELERAAVGMDPAGEILIWSDMFDPFHNATPDATYYLVNGSWSGSWEGLGSRTVIVNWNSNPQSRRDSASFFAERGHRQILAGYYDSPPASFSDKTWLEDLAGVDGIDGVMYTPWSTGYDNLEAWASHVWGGAPWVTVGVSARVWLPVTSH